MRLLELFSGAGGLAKGLELAGFNHVALVENNHNACLTLQDNFSSEKVWEGDIRKYNFNSLYNIDVVAGGPPCQPFSLGGKHKSSNDDRDMFPYAIKAIQVLKPKAFIFENVKGLLRSSFSDYFDYIIFRLGYPDHSPKNNQNWKDHLSDFRDRSKNNEEPEYKVSFKLINTANYGVPQTRERVIIVGVRNTLNAKWEFPKERHTIHKLLWEQYVSGEYWERHKIRDIPKYSYTKNIMRKIEIMKEQNELFPPDGYPWITIRDALSGVPDPTCVHNIEDHVFRNGAKIYPGHTGSIFDLPSKTIKAGGHGVPGGENMILFPDGSVRYLTVHEAKLVQSFPKSFQIHGAWGEAMRQIGNAVPVSIGKILGNQLMDTVLQSKTKNKKPFENRKKVA